MRNLFYAGAPVNTNESNQDRDRERELRERIASLLRANEQVRRKPITGEELQTLRTAASRLDQMLKASPDAERQALAEAGARLNQLLADIGSGKDVGNDLKRRRDWLKREE